MPSPTLRRKLITDAVLTRAATISGAQVFRAEIDDALATLPNSDRVSRYMVIYPFGGSTGPDVDLGDSIVDLDYSFQATVAAGHAADAEYLVDQVHATFFRWAPNVTGLVCSPFHLPIGYDPGPLRRDEDVQPPRFWMPLQYVTTATTVT